MHPLVSCVLCTRNNRHMIPVAIASYLSQYWPNKELVVVDDGEDCIYDLVKDIPGVVIPHLDAKAPNLSVKRNIAARAARGEILMHLDSDDWSAPTRIHHQVEALRSVPGAQLSGYHTAYFWDEIDTQASCYHGPHNYSWGPCLCYYREFVLANPWPEWIAFCEDNNFVQVAQQRNQMVAVDGSGQIVVRLHKDNGRRAYGVGDWPLIPTEQLPKDFLQLIT